MTSPERIDFLGIPLDPLTLEESVAFVDRVIETGGTAQQASVNAAKVVRSRSDRELAEALASCDLVLADGQSVVWGARFLGHRLPERVAGIDLMQRLLARAAERGYRVFLLGARADVLAAAAAEIARRHPGIEVVGTHHGYYTQAEEPAVVEAIRDARPDLLFVALETPQKELFLARVRDVVRVPYAMGVGGSFDVLAGRRKRAPAALQRLGLEWLFRWAQEPRRLGRRYLVGNLRFIGLVLRELPAARGRGSGA